MTDNTRRIQEAKSCVEIHVLYDIKYQENFRYNAFNLEARKVFVLKQMCKKTFLCVQMNHDESKESDRLLLHGSIYL